MRDYLETFFRHKWLFFVPALTVLVLALAGGYYTSAQYESHASLWVSNQTAIDQSLTTLSLNQQAPGESHLAELQGLMQTDNFLKQVIDNSSSLKGTLHSAKDYDTEYAALRKNVQVYAPSANLITIQYKDKNQSASHDVVAGIVTQYQAWSIQQQQNDLQNTVSFLGDQYKDATAKTATANDALTKFETAHPADTRNNMAASDELEYQRLQSEYHAALDRQSAIYDAQQKALFSLNKVQASQKSAISIADAPTMPESATLSMSRIGAIGLLGLVVGMGLGFTCIALATWFGRKPAPSATKGDVVPAWVDRLIQPEVEA